MLFAYLGPFLCCWHTLPLFGASLALFASDNNGGRVELRSLNEERTCAKCTRKFSRKNAAVGVCASYNQKTAKFGPGEIWFFALPVTEISLHYPLNPLAAWWVICVLLPLAARWVICVPQYFLEFNDV